MKGGKTQSNSNKDARTRICSRGHRTRSHSPMHLVDLAGSERGKKSGSDGTTLKEANYINRSLSYLEQVVIALTQSKREHPLRQSKLTHLLKDFCNRHTALISCIWPHQNHAGKHYQPCGLSRMKNIENTPVRNNLLKAGDFSGGNAALVKQINALKKELAMRDTISGAEPALLELTVPQKSAIMKQACEIVGSHIPTHGHTASLSHYYPTRVHLQALDRVCRQLVISIMPTRCCRSTLLVHMLLSCLRQQSGACDMDPAHVANVLDRTMDAFKEVHDINGAAKTKDARDMPAFAGVEERMR